MAMTLVSTVTVGSGGAASIEFTNIPQTGKDLLVLLSLRSEGGANPNITINGTTANYSGIRLTGGGDFRSSGSNSLTTSFDGLMVANTATANTFTNEQWYFSNYASSAAKSVSVDNVAENNAISAFMNIRANLWNNTAAITAISINAHNSSNELAQHSTASLYIIS